ncbi:MAG: VCBS repeat-containing protein [Planctomycetota bacterium]
MRVTAIVLVLCSTSPLALAQTYLPPTSPVSPGNQLTLGSRPAPPPHSFSPKRVPKFQIVDKLVHQDDFWGNMLVGDANHNGLQEIVIRYVPVGGGQNQIQFHEDDGTGQFNLVYQFDLDDGGLLALGDVDNDGFSDLFYERALGWCDHEFVRRESSRPAGFPDHEVWTAAKEGNVVDFNGTIADSDGDGLLELIVSDSDFFCVPSQLKVFESAPFDQMRLTYHYTVGGYPGNPVVADFDQDQRSEIAIAFGVEGKILLFECTGDNSYEEVYQETHPEFNAYILGVIDKESPDGRPMLFLAGQSPGYCVVVYESLSDNTISRIQTVPVPSYCGTSISQMVVADVLGDDVPEILLDRLCGPVPVFWVRPGGNLTLVDMPIIDGSLEITATRKSASYSGAIALGMYPGGSNPEGLTWVLELR